MKTDCTATTTGLCGNCMNPLQYREEKQTDWIEVICSDCGQLNKLSQIRHQQSKKEEAEKTWR
jgi:hypothetical protein